ncbi:MAG: DUF115 domain-containing protein [Candidatus Omnitrophota bacterium]|jgi:hypothetical protein|nr:MAG: DUF115 domain-containing protein [Candidatus Omnitrophota bacterium]
MNHLHSLNNPFWHKNLQAFRAIDVDLADRLDQIPSPMDNMILAYANDGSPFLGLKLPSGQNIPLNDINNPRKEAEEWSKSLGNECLRGAHVMLIGMGSGYHPLALYQQSDNDTFLRIVEPVLPIFKAALHLMDFTPLIHSPRVRFAVGIDEKGLVQQLFSGIAANRMRAQGIRLVYPKSSAFLHQNFIKQLSQSLAEAIQLDKLKFKTEEIQGKTIFANITANLPMVLRGTPSLRLHGKAAGMPALVIAAGPTLDEAISTIDSIKDRVLIIAVDTAYRILYRHGIPADLVVSLDFTELNARHFDGIESDQALLAAFPGIHPSIVQKYKERTFFFDHASSVDCALGATPFFKNLTSLDPLGDLISYGSTAHAAYHLARLMGCTPILLVGNDLSFPSAKWYADGAMQNEILQPEREKEELLDVPANDGSMTKTSGLYKIYLDAFAELIGKTAGNVINTSRCGAKISGCPYLSLETAVASLPCRLLDKSFLFDALSSTGGIQQNTFVQEINHLIDRCNANRRQLEKLEGQAKSLAIANPKFSQKTKEILITFSTFLSRDPSVYALCLPLCPRSTVELLGQLGNAGLLGGKEWEQNEMAKKRCVHFLEDFKQATIYVSETLEQALRLL